MKTRVEAGQVWREVKGQDKGVEWVILYASPKRVEVRRLSCPYENHAITRKHLRKLCEFKRWSSVALR
jgi:hypothetical protein